MPNDRSYLSEILLPISVSQRQKKLSFNSQGQIQDFMKGGKPEGVNPYGVLN